MAAYYSSHHPIPTRNHREFIIKYFYKMTPCDVFFITGVIV